MADNDRLERGCRREWRRIAGFVAAFLALWAIAFVVVMVTGVR